MSLLLLTAGVAAEQYGQGFLEVLGYVDVAFATILFITGFLVGVSGTSAQSSAPPAIRR